MLRFEFTLDDPVANVALDEAILEHAEQAEGHPELLRLWQPTSPMVVIGRSSPWQSEVNHDFCRRYQIPVVRRSSGGQSIVTGPGCLMYAVLLDYRKRPELRMLDVAHQFVMTHMQEALRGLGVDSKIEGTSDLTVGGRKVSGNSLRCKRNWFIYHGTMICDLDVDLIANCLDSPARQPEYRQERSHEEFLAQLPVTTSELSDAIAIAWSAVEGEFVPPMGLTDQLLQTKYMTEAWNQKL